MKGQRKGRRRKVFACKKFLATCISPFAGQQDGATKTPSAQNVPGEGSPEWRECTPRNGNRRRRIPFRPAEHRRIYRRCGESGAAGTAAASGVYAVASGMETRWPERPGQRQQCWLCAEHDSPPGRPVQPDKFAVMSKKQYPAVQQGNRKQTNDSKQQNRKVR